MEINPYESSEIQDPTSLPPWYALLLRAYVMHHIAAFLGLFCGACFNRTMLSWLFLPVKDPLLTTVMTAIAIPLFDIVVLIEPLNDQAPRKFFPLSVARSIAMLACLVSWLSYGAFGHVGVFVFQVLLTFTIYFTVGLLGIGHRLGN